ncbi:MAG TPA: polysaccharide biosynthesis protein [Firmicutes bacterium]|jgi:stage V sporulation protein B|nr:polysaccharide biosynthesis protein [Bacillota bacterium]
MKRSTARSSLIRGTVQLAAAGICTRIIGLANRVALSRLVGAGGLGLYQMILPLYALLAVGAGLGLSGAVAKMVADRDAVGDHAGGQRIRQIALRLVLAAALVIALLLWTTAPWWQHLLPDRRIYGVLLLMPAAFLFAALSSILRSYTQGRGQMLPTALSQVAEQVVRVSLGLAAAYLLHPYGLEYALLGLFGGIIAGEIACLGTLFLMRAASPALPRNPESLFPRLTGELFSLALPILLIRLSTALTQSIESLMIPGRLQTAGLGTAGSTALYGHLAGMALPLLFLPTVLIIPLNTTLVPAIAAASTLRLKSRLERLINLSLWGALGLGALSAALLYSGAPLLTRMFYGTTAAAGLVTRLAPLAPFAYLQFTTAAVLHGLGRPGYAFSTDLAGTTAGLVIIYHLTAQPQWGINGAVCGYTVAFISIALLDYLLINRFLRKI